MKVVWVRNDKVLPDGQDFRYQDDGSGTHSLVVRDVFPEDAGIYICEAYNAHGEAHCYCRLKVHGECLLLQCKDSCVFLVVSVYCIVCV